MTDWSGPHPWDLPTRLARNLLLGNWLINSPYLPGTLKFRILGAMWMKPSDYNERSPPWWSE